MEHGVGFTLTYQSGLAILAGLLNQKSGPGGIRTLDLWQVVSSFAGIRAEGLTPLSVLGYGPDAGTGGSLVML